MLTEAFTELGPRLAASYHQLLLRELDASSELSAFHVAYVDYAQLDRVLPRPILAYFGYHATSSDVPFADVDDIGDGLLIPQLLRDFLAIHDDIVDEDLDKFGAAPLPVRLSGPGPDGRRITKAGKDIALYYGDLLFAVLLNVARRQRDPARAALIDLIAATLYTNQRGQLAELLAEQRPLEQTTVEDILLIGERKAAYYCYEFPFTVGAVLAGHDVEAITPQRKLLIGIGTASQVIDDITGTFPHVIDNDKDTLGEIRNLRRTIPLVLLAHGQAPAAVQDMLNSATQLTVEQALTLRGHMWDHGIPAKSAALCRTLVDNLQSELVALPTSLPSTAYLADLIDHRLIASLDRLTAALAEA